MSAYQIYDEAIKPLSTGEKLTIARLIINELAPGVSVGALGFDRLKQILPQIERLTLTDQDLAG